MSAMNGHAGELLELLQDGPQEFLIERLARLEDALLGWDKLSGDGELDFSRESLRRIAKTAREFYLANPLVGRGLRVMRYYVFGQGVSVKAKDELVNEVVQEFWLHHRNQAVLTSTQAMGDQGTSLSVEGNLFFALFTNGFTGRVQVRSIPFAEIDEVVCDPQDRAVPWFYKRTWREPRDPLGGGMDSRTLTAYYPDWQHPAVRDPARERPDMVAGKMIVWDTPIRHVRVGGLPDMTFGVPEVYAAIDWARAYARSLSDDATRSAALARFVYRLSVGGGQQRVNAAKSKLGTTLNDAAGTEETNPPPARGSIAVVPKGQELEPMRVAGATLQPDHNRSLRTHTAAAMDLPETFFGDANVGNHATAKTLDRPTELKFAERQELWTGLLTGLCRYAVEQSAMAPYGLLQGKRVINPFDPDDVRIELIGVADDHIDVDFPSILEADLVEYVNAIVEAATLSGSPNAGIFDDKTLRRMLLVALRENDIDAVMAEIEAELAKAGAEIPEEAELAAAVRELREALPQ